MTKSKDVGYEYILSNQFFTTSDNTLLSENGEN